ncbi:DICT sensory domain-containing protein [Candidatus Halobonum tyrrellensis]|uniref:DICT sensory domain-containing protein n=1 Tax=Candidatus Halobonum tyrrellensis TaxID=1431545 RepID=UPI000677A0E8|nr:DICT sensory domain-containing protein [Candidatus Halobonum tyrrellensis]
MTLRRYIDRLNAPPRTLAVLERGPEEPTHRMLAGLFDEQAVEVEVATTDLPDAGGDAVALIEDGDLVASSPMADLEEAILFVNSDLYTTGTRKLADADLPEVLTRLSDARFSLRGYPLAHKEKLLLIAVSRQIELRAYRAGSGTLRSSFQRLSRIEDEQGTRRVYEALGSTDVDVHVYGEPDANPAASMPVTVHEGYGDGYSDSWFVVFRPDGASGADAAGATDADAERDDGGAALVALETSPRVWEGFWTYRPDLVADIDRTIRESL